MRHSLDVFRLESLRKSTHHRIATLAAAVIVEGLLDVISVLTRQRRVNAGDANAICTMASLAGGLYGWRGTHGLRI